MRLVIRIAALASITAVNAIPAGTYGNTSDEPATIYFVNNLDGIQGALEDISKAGKDLNIIENKLEIGIVKYQQNLLALNVVKCDNVYFLFMNLISTPLGRGLIRLGIQLLLDYFR